VAARLICRIGKAAGVKVTTNTRLDAQAGGRMEVMKHASAHDLRGSFGQRQVARVMPALLQAPTRHESIDATIKHYVGRNAPSLPAALQKHITRPSAVILRVTLPTVPPKRPPTSPTQMSPKEVARATRPGLEPGTREPKSLVLPITPPGTGQRR
jgi:hypothetical protein